MRARKLDYFINGALIAALITVAIVIIGMITAIISPRWMRDYGLILSSMMCGAVFIILICIIAITIQGKNISKWDE